MMIDTWYDAEELVDLKGELELIFQGKPLGERKVFFPHLQWIWDQVLEVLPGKLCEGRENPDCDHCAEEECPRNTTSADEIQRLTFPGEAPSNG